MTQDRAAVPGTGKTTVNFVGATAGDSTYWTWHLRDDQNGMLPGRAIQGTSAARARRVLGLTLRYLMSCALAGLAHSVPTQSDYELRYGEYRIGELRRLLWVDI